MNWIKATEILAFLSGGVTLCWTAWKYWIKPEMKKSKAKKQEFRDKMNDVWSELRFNGGGSIKDAIFQVKTSVDKIEIRMDGMEQNQRLAMSLQDIAFWESDENGNCIYASPALCKLLGRSESEILQKGWTAWIHHEDKERIIDSWKSSVEDKTAFDEIYTFKKGDGYWIKVWGVAFPRVSSKNLFGGKMGKLVPIEEPYKG